MTFTSGWKTEEGYKLFKKFNLFSICIGKLDKDTPGEEVAPPGD
jgi:hypothetical protein